MDDKSVNSCGNCLYRNSKSVFSDSYFCLVKKDWIEKEKWREIGLKCDYFKFDCPNFTDENRFQLASEIRQEEAENRRLRYLLRSNWWLVIATFAGAFLAFLATAKCLN